jgi:flavin-dependent thymidylate synthase
MSKVSLIEFTGAGRTDAEWHAADLLLFTKGTRLNMDPEGLEAIQGLSEEAKMVRLTEMAATIPSSWEFVDVTFLLSGVTRACAQQITRTRTGSYSMQSQRVVNLSNGEVTNPYPEGGPLHEAFADAAATAVAEYVELLELGAEPQDARGLLPMNIQCNLLAKYNLRSWVDLFHSRSSLRTQGEYSDIVHQEEQLLKGVWPWLHVFLSSPQEVGLKILEDVAQDLGVKPGNNAGWRVAKAIDLIRRAQ